MSATSVATLADEGLAALQARHDRFSAAMVAAGHDLKTPIGVVAGYVDLLLEQKVGLISGKQRGILEEMKDQSNNLQKMVEDLLALGSLESNIVRCRFKSGDIGLCLRDLCEIWQPRFRKSGLDLFVLNNGGLPSFCFDEVKLQRVVSNLLENAVKYVPRGGSVSVQAEVYRWERRGRGVDIHADETDVTVAPRRKSERRKQASAAPNAVRIRVSDTGPGIPPEFHMEIFDEFFRMAEAAGGGTRSGAEASGGLGLGLAIARRLMHACGGKIWVESEAGKGCTFSIVLPLQPPQGTKEELDVDAETETEDEKVDLLPMPIADSAGRMAR